MAARLSARACVRCWASARAWARISGTAVDSQSSPRRSGPSAKSVSDSRPRASRTAPSPHVSRPSRQRVRAHGAGRAERLEQARAAREHVAGGAGAVDDRGHAQRARPPARAVADGHLDAVRGGCHRADPPARDRQPAAVAQFLDGGRDLRGEPVAVDVPEAREALDEAALLVARQRRPQLGRDGPQRIDGVAPVAAADLGHDGGAAHEAQQARAGSASRRGSGRPGSAAAPPDAVGVREQPAARERDDLLSRRPPPAAGVRRPPSSGRCRRAAPGRARGLRAHPRARDRGCSGRDPRARRREASAGSRGGRLPRASTTRSACAREPSANRSSHGRLPAAGRDVDDLALPAHERGAGSGVRDGSPRAAPRGRRRRRDAGRTSSAPSPGRAAGGRSAGNARGRRAARSCSRRAR